MSAEGRIEIDDRLTYTRRVGIEDAARNLLFINDTAIPVTTPVAPTEDVEIAVIAVKAGVSPGPLPQTLFLLAVPA